MKIKIRTIIFITLTIFIFVVLNGLIIQKEKILKDGKSVLLELAPVDPRSLMQGDFMWLRYKIAGEVETTIDYKSAADGKLVIRLDKNGVGSFVRVYKEGAPGPDEILLRYRVRGGLRLGAESFFFQEGKATYFAAARYGELKVTRSGESVLIGLRDQALRKL